MKRIRQFSRTSPMNGIKQMTQVIFWFQQIKDKYQRSPKSKSVSAYDVGGQLEKVRYYWAITNTHKLALDTVLCCHFDKGSNELKCELRDLKMKLREREVCTFDQRNRETKFASVFYDRRQRVVHRYETECHYDTRGNLTDIYTTSSEFGKASEHFTYDEKGRIIQQTMYDENKSVEYKIVYKYKEDKKISCFEDGHYGVTTYGKNSEIYKSFFPDGVLQTIVMKKYDTHGYMLSSKCISYMCNCTGVYTIPGYVTEIKYEYY